MTSDDPTADYSTRPRSGMLGLEQEASAGMDQGMRVLSYLLSGVLLYGGLGWLADHFLHTAFLLPIGIVGRRRALGVHDHPTVRAGARGVADDHVDHVDHRCGPAVRDHGGSPVTGLLPLLIPLEGEVAPTFGVEDFDVPKLFENVPWFDKYMLQALVAVIVILAFWLIMSSKNKLVPTKSQHLGEAAYNFVRNGIARDMIGHDFRKYLPLLIALFSFVLVNNLFGVFPLTLLPTTAHVGWAYGLAGLVWIVYNGVGIAKHGPLRYLKNTVLPAGVPWFMWPLIVPLEFMSNIIIRPMTLSLRLFANMFAGHLLVLVFVVGGEYLVLHSEPLINKFAGVFAWIFSMAIFALEIFVQALQAFIFTVLTAQYISSAAAEEH